MNYRELQKLCMLHKEQSKLLRCGGKGATKKRLARALLRFYDPQLIRPTPRKPRHATPRKPRRPTPRKPRRPTRNVITPRRPNLKKPSCDNTLSATQKTGTCYFVSVVNFLLKSKLRPMLSKNVRTYLNQIKVGTEADACIRMPSNMIKWYNTLRNDGDNFEDGGNLYTHFHSKQPSNSTSLSEGGDPYLMLMASLLDAGVPFLVCKSGQLGDILYRPANTNSLEYVKKGTVILHNRNSFESQYDANIDFIIQSIKSRAMIDGLAKRGVQKVNPKLTIVYLGTLVGIIGEDSYFAHATSVVDCNGSLQFCNSWGENQCFTNLEDYKQNMIESIEEQDIEYVNCWHVLMIT
jgi:hypothetical protein